jgi:hypothetical protein
LISDARGDDANSDWGAPAVTIVEEQERYPARFGARVRGIEARLERLLASGWRNAAGEAEELHAVTDGLEELGLSGLAARVRAVAAARSAKDALGAVSLALAACRLLRTHLAGEGTLSGEDGWQVVGTRRRRQMRTDGEAQDTLLPVARTAMADGEAWLCLRLHGMYTSERVLVDPTQLASREGPDANRGVSITATEPAWMRSMVRGSLRWRARYPLGASGSIERCVLLNGTLAMPGAGGTENAGSARDERAWESRLLDQTRAVLTKRPNDGAQVLAASGSVRLAKLHAAEAEGYVWPDPAAAEVFRTAGEALRSDDVWAVVWKDDALVQPLALFSPPGLLKNAELIHLVPGLPRTGLR